MTLRPFIASAQFIGLLALISLSGGCKKSKTPTVIGRWGQQKIIQYYTDPFDLQEKVDTAYKTNAFIEFKSNGEFWADGLPVGTFTFSNDSTINLPLYNLEYTIVSLDNTNLAIRRAAITGEDKKIIDPNHTGMYWTVRFNKVIVHYRR